MAAFHRTAGEAEALPRDPQSAPSQPAVEAVLPSPRRPFALREKASRRELAGQLLVVWCAAYLAVRPTSSTLEAVWRAALVSGIWVVLFQRAAQALRAMTFAAGALVVAGIASVVGVFAMSAIGYWLPVLELGRETLALVGLATFVALGAWDVFVRRAASAPRRVLVVGGGAPTARLLDHIDAERHINLEVIGVVDDAIDPHVAERVGVTARLDHLSAMSAALTGPRRDRCAARAARGVRPAPAGGGDGLPGLGPAGDVRVDVRPAPDRGADAGVVHGAFCTPTTVPRADSASAPSTSSSRSSAYSPCSCCYR